MEYCHNGSLFDVLRDSHTEINWPRVIRFSIDIVRGVNCLHSWKPVVVHRDLKSLNLFVDSNFIVKVKNLV